MSTGIFLKSNILRVHQNFLRWADEVGDLTSAFTKFVPEFQRTRVGWIYAGRTVDGKRFASLSPKYKAYKMRKYGNQPILIASGTLINAIRGGQGWKQHISPKELEMEINLPYASIHQDGGARMPRRNYFLTREGTLNKMDYAQLLQAIEGEIEETTKTMLNRME